MDHKPTQLYRGPLGWLAEPVVRRLRGHGLVYRYRLLWKAHRAMWRVTRSNRVQIDGHDLEVDRLDSLALAKGWYEPDETTWYRTNVRAGDFVVEAGANIGFFTLMLARLVGPEGRVLCFEPDPLLRGILERNIITNQYNNITVRAFAVADAPGELTFYRAVKNQGDNRLFSHGRDGASFPVKVVTLDDELDTDTRQVDLLKMDIQGAEPLALQGMSRILKTRPPKSIMMEFWPHGIIGMSQDPRRPVEQLLAAGYTVTELNDGTPFDLDQGLRSMTDENQGWVNLLFQHDGDEAH